MGRFPSGNETPIAYARTDALAPDQRVVEDELDSIIQTRPDGRYDALTDALGGRLLNTDIARDLSPVYRVMSKRLRHAASTLAPAKAYTVDRLARELMRSRSEPADSPKRLLVAAGSAGSGKSFTMSRLAAVGEAEVVWDTQLLDPSLALEVINRADAWQWQTTVVYIHRPFDEVVEAIVRRCVQTGRPVTMRNAIEHRLAAQRSLRTLVEHYRSKEWPKSAKMFAYFNTSRQCDSGEVDIDQLVADPRFVYDRTMLEEIARGFLGMAQREDIFPHEVLDHVNDL
jgi:hypothetical protein